MISRGLFQTQLNDIERVLQRLKLLDERGGSPSYAGVGAAFFRKMNYSQTWLWCHQNNFFDFLLNDGALFQFKHVSTTPTELSYVYYESPFLPILSLEEFISEHELEEEDDEYELLRLYEFYIADPPRKETVTPIRYDYSPNQYVCGRHPASHIHLGHNNNVRIGTKKVLRPLSFLLFILRQHYPDHWSAFISGEDAPIICRNVRDHLADIDNALWKEADHLEMSLI